MTAILAHTVTPSLGYITLSLFLVVAIISFPFFHKRENKSKQFKTNSFIKENAEKKRLQEMSLKEKDYKKNRERKGSKRREIII